MGYEEEEIPGLSLFEIIHPDSMEHCREMFQRVVAGEEVKHVEAKFVAKDGKTLLVEGSANCRFVDGVPVATHGIFRDVTERKRAEETLRQRAVEPGKHTKRFTCGRDLFEHYHLRLRDKKREHFVCALLDQRNRLIKDEVVSVGSLSHAYVRLREAFSSAVRESAAAVAFIHNHPSGDARPSEEDRLLTTKLVDAAELLDIRLLDHVIIGDGCFYSFFEEGVL